MKTIEGGEWMARSNIEQFSCREQTARSFEGELKTSDLNGILSINSTVGLVLLGNLSVGGQAIITHFGPDICTYRFVSTGVFKPGDFGESSGARCLIFVEESPNELMGIASDLKDTAKRLESWAKQKGAV